MVRPFALLPLVLFAAVGPRPTAAQTSVSDWLVLGPMAT